MREFCSHSTATIDNGFLRLDYLTDVGPRIARLFPAASDVNPLAEVPNTRSIQFMADSNLWVDIIYGILPSPFRAPIFRINQ
jgi:hypothetical protein